MKSKKALTIIVLLVVIGLFDIVARRYSRQDPAPAATPTQIMSPTVTPTVYYIIEGMEEPRPIKTVDPKYPPHAYAHNREGLVILSVIITEQGEVNKINILHSAGIDLDEAAIEAVRQWRYEPATLDGKPVAVFYNISVQFRKELSEK